MQCLYFLLPLLIAYQIGAVLYAPEQMDRVPAVLAEALLRRFFEFFGVTGVYLPGLLVITVLLAWHVAARDPWEPEPYLYVGMLMESIVLAVPLWVLGALVMQGDVLAETIGMGEPLSWQALMVISIGAGIFEELLFRLFAIALIHGLLVDVLGLSNRVGVVAAVTLSSLAFAVYHFGPDAPFDWALLALYSLAGAYLAAVYLVRGFGVVVGVHAIYDVVVFSLR